MIENLYDYNCQFDWLLKEIEFIEDAKDTSRIKDKEFIILHGDRDPRGGKQAKRIEGIVEEFQKACNFLNATDDNEDEEINECYNLMYKEYFDKINTYSISLECMSLMIARVLIVDNKFLKSNAKIKTKLLNMLYKKDREWFLECFKDCDEKFVKK